MPKKDSIAITNFDKNRYICAEFAQQEWSKVWRKTWLLAGFIQDLARPGCYFTFDVGPETVVVTRTNDGEIKAFHNVCQHRGAKLIRNEFGQKSRLTCSYHAWSYGLDGALLSAPQISGFSNGLPCEKLALKPVKVEVWSAFVFINFDSDAQSLTNFLGEIPDEIAAYRFEKMLLTEDKSVHHQCNWKAFMDNFSELYHVDFIHPQHREFVNCAGSRSEFYPNGHTAVWVEGGTVDSHFPIPDEPNALLADQLESLDLNPDHFNGKVSEVRRAIQVQKRIKAKERGFDFTALSDDQLSDIGQYNIFPNLILSFTPEACWIMRARPHPDDPQRSYFDKYSLSLFGEVEEINDSDPASSLVAASDGHQTQHFRLPRGAPADYQRPQRESMQHEQIVSGEKTMDITIDQDIHLLADVQAGMRSTGFDRVWLHDTEARVQHLHNQIDAMIDA